MSLYTRLIINNFCKLSARKIPVTSVTADRFNSGLVNSSEILISLQEPGNSNEEMTREICELP